jgi:hypothetical protein
MVRKFKAATQSKWRFYKPTFFKKRRKAKNKTAVSIFCVVLSLLSAEGCFFAIRAVCPAGQVTTRSPETVW